MAPLNTLQGIKATGTVVIADTADFNIIHSFRPAEGTTNPSLLYQAAQQTTYAPLVAESIRHAQGLPTEIEKQERLECAVDYLAVLFGFQIYQLTGRVATEVNVRHSFNTQATVEAALRILGLYGKKGVPKSAVRIKISATWEGIQAGRILERDHGASVLITVVFGLVQAIAAAEAGVSCIAPYVGRIRDWFGVQSQGPPKDAATDMGVVRVHEMQNYLRKYHPRTQVMGASLRSIEQVKDLAGIDMLTLAPSILSVLEGDESAVVPQLTDESTSNFDMSRVSYINDESAFRWGFNNDACAVEKSADAMRRFAEDTNRLMEYLAQKFDDSSHIEF